MLIEETPIAKARLPVEPFRAHMRLGTGFGLDDVQDAVIVAFLRAAIAAAEARTGRCLLSRDFVLTVSEWHAADAHRFPVLPVTTILEVVHVAGDGTRTIAAPASYWLDRTGDRPRLRAITGNLPTLGAAETAEVSFAAGAASTWEEVPADLQQAVLMLAAHYYEYRNDTGLSEGCMPFGVSSLLEHYRIMRLGKGPDQ